MKLKPPTITFGSAVRFFRDYWPVLVMSYITVMVIAGAIERSRSPELRKRECSILDQETGTLTREVIATSDPAILLACERGTAITAAEIE